MALSFERSRKSLRLPQQDYAGGVYYVTQATHNRQHLFGSLVSGRVRLSLAGQMVQETWQEMPSRCPWCEIDAFIVMPDHLHFVVRIQRVAETSLTAETSSAATKTRFKRATESGSETLFDFMRIFKSLSTTRFIHGVREQGWPPFDGKVWQREYYERIIRHDEKELDRIREYIRNNPVHANVLRFGELQFFGDMELMKLRKTAFLACRTTSRRSSSPPFSESCGDELRRDIANAQCVISGFLSPLECDVFRYCRARNIPTIHVLARGTDDGLDRRRQAPPQQLIVTPFDSAIATVNEVRAAWCNQYAMENADEIVIGSLNPQGLLAFQLSDLPKSKPVKVW